MHTTRTDRLSAPEAQTGWLTFVELREQLDTLWSISDRLIAHLEARRDRAERRGDMIDARAMERGLLQVTRVRNEVRNACHDLDAVEPCTPSDTPGSPSRNAA